MSFKLLRDLLERVQSPLFHTHDEFFSISAILTEEESFMLSTPLKPLTPSLDMSVLSDVELVVQVIVKNFLTAQQTNKKNTWHLILLAIDRAVAFLLPSSQENEMLTRNARLSLLLIASRQTATDIAKFTHLLFAENIVATLVDVIDFGNDIKLFRACQRVRNATLSASQPYAAVSLPLPPLKVVSITGLPSRQLRGWVMFNNTIAVLSTTITDLSTASLRLALATLLGHEEQQSLVRYTLQDANAPTPNLIPATATTGSLPEAESGARWERAVWYGMCPKWHDPVDKAGAEVLAERILAQLRQDGDFRLSEQEQLKLRVDVGSRNGVYTGGWDCDDDEDELL